VMMMILMRVTADSSGVLSARALFETGILSAQRATCQRSIVSAKRVPMSIFHRKYAEGVPRVPSGAHRGVRFGATPAATSQASSKLE
jgi:hypothetical protein